MKRLEPVGDARQFPCASRDSSDVLIGAVLPPAHVQDETKTDRDLIELWGVWDQHEDLLVAYPKRHQAECYRAGVSNPDHVRVARVLASSPWRRPRDREPDQ